MRINRVACICFLFISNFLFGQEAKSAYTFFDYLLDISEEYQIDFAIDPGAGKDIVVDKEKAIKNNRQEQIDELTLLLTDNDMIYLIVDDYTILVRKRGENKRTNTLSVQGKVRDQDNGEELPFVSVFVNGTSIGTSTNLSGDYSLNIPIEYIGKDLIFQYLGYENVQMPIPEEDKTINILCQQKAVSINTILISQIPPDIIIDALGESVNVDLSSYERMGAQAFFDGSRSRVGNLASVNQFQDRNGIYIRGLESNSLLLLDNIPIYRYDQFYQFLPLYNSSYFDQLKVFKNTSPIDKNHHAFGILEVSNNPQADPYTLAFESNLFYGLGELNIDVEPDHWNIKIGARKSLASVEKILF